MPSPIIHLDVLVKLCRLMNRPLSSALVLGVISPDAIHRRLKQTWADKAKTHFYEETSVSYEYALQEARQLLQDSPADFLMGYLIHLYTDYVWRDQVYAPYFHAYKDQMPKSLLYEHYYHDMDQLDRRVLSQATWIDEIRQRFMEIDSAEWAMPLLTSQELMGWKDKVLIQDLVNQRDLEALDVLSLNDVHRVCEDLLDQLVTFFEKT